MESVPGKTLYRKVYRAILDMILKEELGPGLRLPSTRQLAGQLGISRNSVSHAYEQLLLEGYLESRPGSGSYVSGQLPASAARKRRLYEQEAARQRVMNLIAKSGFPMRQVDVEDYDGNQFYVYSSHQ
jgi:GntR family transcriptional regulator/MocR family aminotransferase